MSNTLKLALVGCGAIARFHLDGIQEAVPRIRVTAAVDIDPQRAQEIASETGAKVFETLEAALAGGDFDAVDLMLPHDLHESAATASFAAGKHVLLEKPMAPTLTACQRIKDAAQRAGTVFMVAENAQYWPEIVKVQQLLRDGAIGQVVTARAAFVFPVDKLWLPNQQAWRYNQQRTGGGIVIDGGSHWLRPLRMWMGEIDEVVAMIGHPLEQMEGESLTDAIVHFESGKFASFHAMMSQSPLAPQPWWQISGTGGQIMIHGDMAGEARLYNADHPEGRSVMEPKGYAKSFGPELADFTSAVLDGTKLAAGPDDSLRELRTVLAIYRSAQTKQWEKV